MDTDELYFEITDGLNHVRVTPKRFSYPDADLVWDSDWIKAEVAIRAGAFSGSYEADFMTVDFRTFKSQLVYLYDNLNATARFEGLESFISINIKGDGIGHLEVFCEACDNPGWMASNFEFYLNTDQTYIQPLIRQLENIINEFPAKDM